MKIREIVCASGVPDSTGKIYKVHEDRFFINIFTECGQLFFLDYTDERLRDNHYNQIKYLERK